MYVFYYILYTTLLIMFVLRNSMNQLVFIYKLSVLIIITVLQIEYKCKALSLFIVVWMYSIPIYDDLKLYKHRMLWW